MDAQAHNDAGQNPETAPTQNSPMEQPMPTLPEWWEQADFPEKEFLKLEDDRLLLKGTDHFPDRQVAVLQPQQAGQTLEELREKFKEATMRVEKLGEDWAAAEEVLKLQSRLRSLRDYLTHLQAVGNMAPLFEKLEGWEKEIKDRLNGNTMQREEIVKQAEALADSEQWKETAQKYRELEEQWKQAPAIEKAGSDALRQRMDAAKDKFYERRRVHQEEVEKDMAQSLDLKLEIVEKAERMAKSVDWKVTTEGFRELMDQWKQSGKTFSDKQEELWQRFQDARTAFFERKRLHHQEIQSEQEENYEKKLALVAQAESLQNQTNWTATAREFERLQQEWNSIGRVPQEKSDELWQRLHKAKDTFYGNRRQHNEQLMGQLQENLKRKQELIQRAQEVSHSTQWREGTEEMNELMAEWKKVGPAPRELNEKVWEQFLAARKSFFERKDANREQHKARMAQQHDRRLHQTRNFLHTLESELKEETANLADFRESLSKLTSGPKEEELRRHLKNLIAQAESGIERRNRKIEAVREQLKTIESRQDNEREKRHRPGPRQDAAPQQEDRQKGQENEGQPAAENEAQPTASSGQAETQAAAATETPPEENTRPDEDASEGNAEA